MSVNITQRFIINGELPIFEKDADEVVYIYVTHDYHQLIETGIDKYMIPTYHIDKTIIEKWIEKMESSSKPNTAVSGAYEAIFVTTRDLQITEESRYGAAFFFKKAKLN